MVRVTPGRLPAVVARRGWVQNFRRSIGRRAEGSVAWLDERRLGTATRWGVGFVVAAIPTMQNFRIVESPWWLVLWLSALLAFYPLEHFRHGSAFRRLLRGVGSVNSSFSGSIVSLARKLPPDLGCLTEEGSQLLCIGLLHRVRDYAATALSAEGGRPRLRATLAVPIVPEAGGSPVALRVWAYDEPHYDSGYTVLPLHVNGESADGAAAAFLTREIQIINDIRTVGGKSAPGAAERTYRSILSIPVSAKGPDGRPLAVVSVDADEPNFFEPVRVLDRVLPLVAPVLSTIGLTLRLRQPGVAYEFPA